MTISDLKRAIEDLPDSMEFYVVHGEKALHIAGMGTAQLGRPATFPDSAISLVQGLTVFEITARDNA